MLFRLLDDVVAKLGGNRLPDLEAGDNIREGEWFRLHRQLRAGVGCADSHQSVKALVVADEFPVPEGLSIPRLLMTGSVAHVRHPYATDELRNAPGSRSGSRTDQLFLWLVDAWEALEGDPRSGLAAVAASGARPPRDPWVAMSMYDLFTREGWMDPDPLPRLSIVAPCEGVAQASFVAVDENTTLVMASPLFVRIRALPVSDRP